MELDQDMYDDNYDGTVKPDQIDPSRNPDADTVEVVRDREEALHLRGTDDMSTSDVHTYLSLFTTDVKPRIEWIDDTSLNLVYYTPSDARIALAHLTPEPTDLVTSSNAQPAQLNPAKPEARLTIRIATTADRKEKGAKDRSRWYLFHPEDDPDSRIRNQERGNRRRSRRGGAADEPYSKTGRHERRIAAGIPGSEDLFASKLSSTDASHLPPIKLKPDLFSDKKNVSGEDLFTSRLNEAAKVSQKREKKSKGIDRQALPSSDLFARLGETKEKVVKGQDLFADRLGGEHLAQRISGGPIRTKEISFKGASKRAKASDLF